MNLRRNRQFIKFIRLAVKSLLQHKLRATLSILGVVCGVAAVFSMLSVSEGARREALSQLERLGTRNIYVKSVALTDMQIKKSRAGFSQGLTLYDAQRIKQGNHVVTDVAGLRELKASLFNAAKDIMPQIVSCTSNYASLLKITIDRGRFICDMDTEDGNLVCVIGHSVANSMGASGTIGNYLRIENSLFRIVGILNPTESKAEQSGAISLRNFDDMIFIPMTAANLVNKAMPKSAAAAKGSSEVNELIISVRTEQQVLNSVPAIKRILEITHGGVEDYQIVVPKELLNQSRKIQRIFNIVLGSIAFISLLIGGIGIMNIMLATVSERTKEIGMRRAFGATCADIIIQFLAESTILTFTGGIIGVFIGFGGVWLISAIAKWVTTISLISIILPLLTSTVTGIFFGIYPAYTAARMDPIASLRSE
jgi:putative ABC transport system permease protein